MKNKPEIAKPAEGEADEVKRFGVYLKDSTLALVKEYYQKADCKNYSDFISRAIQFYVEFLALDDCSSVIPNIISNTMQDIVRESNNKQGRMMFKIAVELSVLANVIASQEGIPEESMDRLRGICTNEVKKLNGSISYEDAVRWQS